MQPKNPADATPDAGDAAVPPTAMRHPPHGVVDSLDIAGHDEVEHESALRDSTLRVPR